LNSLPEAGRLWVEKMDGIIRMEIGLLRVRQRIRDLDSRV